MAPVGLAVRLIHANTENRHKTGNDDDDDDDDVAYSKPSSVSVLSCVMCNVHRA